MKIKIADIPINVIDGIDKYPKTSIFVFSFLLGCMAASLTFTQWGVFIASCVGVVAALAGAWYLGKPK